MYKTGQLSIILLKETTEDGYGTINTGQRKY